MKSEHPTSLVFLLSLLKGAGQSKEHLQRAAHETLLATKSISSTLASVVDDLDLGKRYPWLTSTFRKSNDFLNDLVERTGSESESEKAADEKTQAVNSKVTQIQSKRKTPRRIHP